MQNIVYDVPVDWLTVKSLGIQFLFAWHFLFSQPLREPTDDDKSDLTSKSFGLFGLREASTGGSVKIIDNLGCFSISF